MNVKRIDQKHGIQLTDEGELRVVKITADGRYLPIGDEEPVILFRARDYLAVPLLDHYVEMCKTDGATEFQINQMNEMVERFRAFARENPHAMKQPGVTRGL